MLGLIVVGAWTAFVSGYLVWQQITGDLCDEAGIYRLPSLPSASLNLSSARAQTRGVLRVVQTDG